MLFSVTKYRYLLLCSCRRVIYLNNISRVLCHFHSIVNSLFSLIDKFKIFLKDLFSYIKRLHLIKHEPALKLYPKQVVM